MLINRYSPTYRNTTMPKNTPTRKKTTAPYSIAERCFMNFRVVQQKINVAEYKNKKKTKQQSSLKKLAN